MDTILNFIKQKGPAILGVLTALGGLLSDPSLLNLLPEKYSVALLAIGGFILTFTKALHAPVEPPAPKP